MSHNIYVTSGDDYLQDRRLVVTVTDEAGTVVELTGLDMTFEVKASTYAADALIAKTVGAGIEIPDQTGAAIGIAYVELDAVDTDALDGKYRWELEADDSTGTITLGAGGFYVAADQIHP